MLLCVPGHFHTVAIQFCGCEEEPVTLLRFGYWAATPNQPTVGFSVELLKFLHFLTLESAVSVKGFVEMLRWKNSLTGQEVWFPLYIP